MYEYRGNLDRVNCGMSNDPNTFREVTIEELISLKECYYVSNSEDNVWQYYFVRTGRTMNDGYFVKIREEVVAEYTTQR